MRLTIRTKLLGGFLLLVALLLVVFATGYFGLVSMGTAADRIVHEELPEDEMARDLELLLAEQETHYVAYALTLEETELTQGQAYTLQFNAKAAQLEELLRGDAKLLGELQQVEAEYKDFVQHNEEMASLYAAGNRAAGLEKLHEVERELAQMEEQLADLTHEIEAQIEQAFQAAAATERRAIMIMSVVTLIAVIVALGVAFLLSRSISQGVIAVRRCARDLATRVLPDLAAVTEAIAAGDLTRTVNVEVERVAVTSRDEIGRKALPARGSAALVRQ